MITRCIAVALAALVAAAAQAAPLVGVASVAAGPRRMCAVMQAGGLTCWGLNPSFPGGRAEFQPVPLEGIGDAVEASVGADTLCFVTRAGGVRCREGVLTSQNRRNEPASKLDDALHIVGSDQHRCVLRRSGRVFCWGDNGSGQLGLGTVGRTASAGEVAGLTGVAQISAGDGHSCARTTTGQIWCWGRRLGLANPHGNPLLPQRAPGVDDAIDLAAGDAQTCVVRRGGSVWCWGHGAFGVSGRMQSFTPAQVPGVSRAVSVSVAFGRVCAVLDDHTISCWGTGALGDGKVSNASAPATPVAGVADARGVAVGGDATCSWSAAGQVKCWARPNAVGAEGRSAHRMTPARVEALHGAIRLAAAATRTCGLRPPGEVVCTGPGGMERFTVADAAGATALAVSDSHACILRKGGSVACWGKNESWQLGDGTKVDRPAAQPAVPVGQDAVEIAATETGTCALLRSGRGVCWGAPYHQLDLNGDQQARPVPIPALRDGAHLAGGLRLTCALRRSGDVTCWDGYTYDASLALARREALSGDPGRQGKLSPAILLGQGMDQECSVRRDTRIACFGGCYYPIQGTFRSLQRGIFRLMPGTKGILEIAPGGGHACMLREGGTVSCWGDNAFGQCGSASGDKLLEPVVVPETADAIQIVSGAAQSCALTRAGDVVCWGYDQDGRLSGVTSCALPAIVEEGASR